MAYLSGAGIHARWQPVNWKLPDLCAAKNMFLCLPHFHSLDLCFIVIIFSFSFSLLHNFFPPNSSSSVISRARRHLSLFLFCRFSFLFLFFFHFSFILIFHLRMQLYTAQWFIFICIRMYSSLLLVHFISTLCIMLYKVWFGAICLYVWNCG